jgi:uncharacterized protein (DUF58 family)
MKNNERIEKYFSKFARKNQIYILPTRYGLVFLFSVIFMLLVGAIYNNNLVNLLAFFLTAIAIVCMVQTHDNLKGIKIKTLRAGSGFADSFMTVETTLENPSRVTRFNLDVRIPDLDFYEETSEVNPITAFSRSQYQTVYRSQKRGAYKIARVRISSIYPLGLFYTWTYVATDSQYFIYPKANGKLPLPQSSVEGDNSSESQSSGEDFSGHRQFQKTDSPRRVDWKAYARGRGLMIKEFKSGSSRSLLLDLESCSQSSIEERLEQLSQWIEYCRKKEIYFALKLPKHLLTSGSGGSHVKKALEELAKYGAA